MKKNRIYIAAVALLALAGCNKEMSSEATGAITVNASIGTATKVVYNGDDASFTAGDQIAVYAWMGSASEVPAQRVVDGVKNAFDGTNWTPEKQMRWKTVTDPHYFLGVYPVKEITDFKADAYTLNPADFTASDLLIATNLGGVKASDGPVALEFDHAMAKLNVNLKFRSQWAGTPDVTSVTVKARKTAAVDYLTKTVTATGDAEAVGIPAVAAVSGYARSYSSLEVPQTGVREIVVTIDGKEYTYTAQDDIPLESGKYTTLALYVGKDKIELASSITVTGWDATPDVLEGEAVSQLTTPLTFEAAVAGAKVSFSIVAAARDHVYYRTGSDDVWSSWAPYANNNSVVLEHVGDKVQFKGDNEGYSTSDDYSTFSMTEDCYVYGNIMSLIDSKHFWNCFKLNGRLEYLFYENEHLLSHPRKALLLPATELTPYCYDAMFAYCTQLTVAPKLPATTLANGCYKRMFWNCTQLTVAPELPAKKLANYCYQHMFWFCRGLRKAPALPAKELAEYCYSNMFSFCTSLETAPELPAEKLTRMCYGDMFNQCSKLRSVTCLATDISAMYCTQSWLSSAGTQASGPRMVITRPPSSMVSADWPLDSDSGIPTDWTRGYTN